MGEGVAVEVRVTAGDREAIEALMEGSPFKRDMLLSIALRIGLQSIQKDPTILMPFLSKLAPPDDD